jgi:hypothetical protein
MRRIKALWIMFMLAMGRGFIRIFGASAEKRAEFQQLELDFQRKIKEKPL